MCHADFKRVVIFMLKWIRSKCTANTNYKRNWIIRPTRNLKSTFWTFKVNRFEFFFLGWSYWGLFSHKRYKGFYKVQRQSFQIFWVSDRIFQWKSRIQLNRIKFSRRNEYIICFAELPPPTKTVKLLFLSRTAFQKLTSEIAQLRFSWIWIWFSQTLWKFPLNSFQWIYKIRKFQTRN